MAPFEVGGASLARVYSSSLFAIRSSPFPYGARARRRSKARLSASGLTTTALYFDTYSWRRTEVTCRRHKGEARTPTERSRRRFQYMYSSGEKPRVVVQNTRRCRGIGHGRSEARGKISSLRGVDESRARARGIRSENALEEEEVSRAGPRLV